MGLFSWLFDTAEEKTTATVKQPDINASLLKTAETIQKIIIGLMEKATTPSEKSLAFKAQEITEQAIRAAADASDPEAVKKKKEVMKWQDVNEPIKYVCQGAKVFCMYCSVPIGDLFVTSTQVKLQDTFWATNGDRNGAPVPNLVFKGVCMHPKWGIPKPPCIGVIQLGQWKNISQTHIDNWNALLRKSTIPCLHSMQDIFILHSGQKAVPEELKIKTRKFPAIREIRWMDKEMENTITNLGIMKKASLLIRTKDYEEGETVTVTLKGENGAEIAPGKTEITVTGTVGPKGIVKIKEAYEGYRKGEDND